MNDQDSQVQFGSANQPASPSSSKKRFTRRRIIIAVVVATLLIAAGVIAWMVLRGTGDTSDDPVPAARIEPKKVCTEATIDAASQAIRDSNITQMRTTSLAILDMPDYRHDINCTYILTRYYIMTGQVEEATAALRETRARNDSGQTVSYRFDPPPISMTLLERNIEVLKQQDASMKGSTIPNYPPEGAE